MVKTLVLYGRDFLMHLKMLLGAGVFGQLRALLRRKLPTTFRVVASSTAERALFLKRFQELAVDPLASSHSKQGGIAPPTPIAWYVVACLARHPSWHSLTELA